MSRDAAVTDGLVEELVRELSRTVMAQQIPPDPDAPSLLIALSSALIWEEYPPATLTDLFDHEATLGRVAILVASDLTEQQQDELPELLRRLESETRSAQGAERLAVIVIGHRGHLPHFAGGESSDVNLATVWWWNRVARWDVAAHIAQAEQELPTNRVLADVRIESIVEVARWDLDLAEGLAEDWNGDPSLIIEIVGKQPREGVVEWLSAGQRCGPRPGEGVVEQWDSGLLDGWHDIHCLAPSFLAYAEDQLDRLVWAAQARILLPWIEERRVVLLERTKAALGQRAFRNALNTLFVPPLENASGLVEIGPLKIIIEARIGSTDPRLRAAVRRLHSARNALAHLTPLRFAQLTELAVVCDGLESYTT